MAKTPAELAALISILKGAGSDRTDPELNSSTLPKSFDGISVGFVDPRKWQLPGRLLKPSDEYTEEVVSLTINFCAGKTSLTNPGIRIRKDRQQDNAIKSNSTPPP
jgi:hypothetical protein